MANRWSRGDGVLNQTVALAFAGGFG